MSCTLHCFSVAIQYCFFGGVYALYCFLTVAMRVSALFSQPMTDDDVRYAAVAKHYNLGCELLLRQNDASGAVLAFRAALEMDSTSTDEAGVGDYSAVCCFTNLGNALQQEGDDEGALEAFKNAIALNPEHRRALIGCGNAISAQGDHRGAIGAFMRVLEVCGDEGGDGGLCISGPSTFVGQSLDEVIHFNIGQEYTRLGELVRAATWFEKALRINPTSMLAQSSLAHAIASMPEAERNVWYLNRETTEEQRYRQQEARKRPGVQGADFKKED
jgi:tetratricopeptide (TPR) repeat protein